jgi:hypothetical protein
LEPITAPTDALCQIDNLAEHAANHLAQNPGKYRDQLRQREPMLGIARDVHDTHKHGRLTRSNAEIKQGQRAEIVSRGGAIGAGAIGASPIGGGSHALYVTTDSTEMIFIPQAIMTGFRFWEIELTTFGL